MARKRERISHYWLPACTSPYIKQGMSDRKVRCIEIVIQAKNKYLLNTI